MNVGTDLVGVVFVKELVLLHPPASARASNIEDVETGLPTFLTYHSINPGIIRSPVRGLKYATAGMTAG